jgi:hypothetical protein
MILFSIVEACTTSYLSWGCLAILVGCWGRKTSCLVVLTVLLLRKLSLVLVLVLTLMLVLVTLLEWLW